MNTSKKEYAQMTKQVSPTSKSYRNIPFAFLIGGAICVLGQALTTLFLSLGLDKQTASTATSMSLIVLAALLTALDLYKRIAKVAGAGTLVPITGFSNSVVAPALEFKSEGYILGLGAKMFTIAGPVLTYGIGASVVYGFIYWILQ